MRTVQLLEDIIEDSFNTIVHRDTPIDFLKLKTIEFIHLHIEIAKVFKVYIKSKEIRKVDTIISMANLIESKKGK